MKTGRPTKWGKKGKLVGVTIPLEDWELIKNQHLDAGQILHKALNLLQEQDPTPVNDSLTAVLVAHWGEFLHHIETLTGTQKNPFAKAGDLVRSQEALWWQVNYQVKITNDLLSRKWNELNHAYQQLKK